MATVRYVVLARQRLGNRDSRSPTQAPGIKLEMREIPSMSDGSTVGTDPGRWDAFGDAVGGEPDLPLGSFVELVVVAAE